MRVSERKRAAARVSRNNQEDGMPGMWNNRQRRAQVEFLERHLEEFADVPTDLEEVTDSGREAIERLVGAMFAANIYTVSTRKPTTQQRAERNMALRRMMRDARATAGVR